VIEPRTPELAAKATPRLREVLNRDRALSTLARRNPENSTPRWASRSLLAKDQQEQPQALPNADQAKAA
jgi:hypothetical protein